MLRPLSDEVKAKINDPASIVHSDPDSNIGSLIHDVMIEVGFSYPFPNEIINNIFVDRPNYMLCGVYPVIWKYYFNETLLFEQHVLEPGVYKIYV